MDLADFPLVAVVQLLFFFLVDAAAGVGVQAALVRLRLRVELVRRGRASARISFKCNFRIQLEMELNKCEKENQWFVIGQNIKYRQSIQSLCD